MNKFNGKEQDLELTSYIDGKQNILLKGKEMAKILGYKDTDKAIRKYVYEEDKKRSLLNYPAILAATANWTTFINEYGLYSLILQSKIETAQKFIKWDNQKSSTSRKKYDYYQLFDSPNK